jgi:hypothetical protein
MIWAFLGGVLAGVVITLAVGAALIVVEAIWGGGRL